MHEFNAMYREIKLENFLINKGVLKIADFGLSKELEDPLKDTATLVGTPLTMAPEILEGFKYGLKVDIYSLGVIFYNLLYHGEYPFNAQNIEQLRIVIKQQIINFNMKGIKISLPLQELIQKMLACDPQ